MDKDRTAICKIISDMLDNPGECEIYPTSKAYDALERYVEDVRVETLVWAHRDACLAVKRGFALEDGDMRGMLQRLRGDKWIQGPAFFTPENNSRE